MANPTSHRTKNTAAKTHSMWIVKPSPKNNSTNSKASRTTIVVKSLSSRPTMRTETGTVTQSIPANRHGKTCRASLVVGGMPGFEPRGRLKREASGMRSGPPSHRRHEERLMVPGFETVIDPPFDPRRTIGQDGNAGLTWLPCTAGELFDRVPGGLAEE